MRIGYEGKVYEVEGHAKGVDFWKQLYGDRMNEHGAMVSLDGQLCDFYTPLYDGAELEWIFLGDVRTERAIQHSLSLLLAMAVEKRKNPKVDVMIKHTLGKSIYCEFSDGHVPRQSELRILEKRMKEIAQNGGAIERIEMDKEKAISMFMENGKEEEAALLKEISAERVSVIRCGSFVDYYVGYLLPDVSLLQDFHLKAYAPGFLITLPGDDSSQKDKEYPLFAKSFLEAQKWTALIGCRTVVELNRLITEGKAEDLIAMTEALQDKKMAQLADLIKKQDPPIQLICIAGPSSSGKTTFMKKLKIHLRVNGLRPVSLSLDDFFRNRDEMGEDSWEDVEAIDLDLFEKTVNDLLTGKEVYTPHFNFVTGKKEWTKEPIRLDRNQPILVEGLHALHPRLSGVVPGYQCIHVYLSALMPLVINNHNRISTADTRLLRRMVRDVKFRGNSVEHTLKTWPSVRAGEERNIFAFQDKADFVFNSALLYEIAVLKKWARPLLKEVKRESTFYSEACRLLAFLSPFCELPSCYVPDNSLLREFIGGRNKGGNID